MSVALSMSLPPTGPIRFPKILFLGLKQHELSVCLYPIGPFHLPKVHTVPISMPKVQKNISGISDQHTPFGF